MPQAASNILVKIFAHGFYKVHAGLLIFLFVTFISYCFFIETAGDIKLLTASQILYYHFIMLITFISDPIMTMLFFIAWLLYTFKSWSYISGQLLVPHHQFLFYSITSFSKFRQFTYWFYNQLIISIPFVGYAVMASLTGIAYHHYIITAIILAFTLLLISVSALWYVVQINKLVHQQSNSWALAIAKSWKKPYLSLYIYYIFNSLKLPFIITKVLSYLVVIGVLFSFADVKADARVAALTVLGLITAHALVIYRQHRFEQTYLSIARNLPISINYRYLHYAIVYALLLLPEGVWVFKSFAPATAAAMLLLSMSLTMLFHSMLYKIGLAMNKYLPGMFLLFLALFMAVLFGLTWVLIPACTVLSYFLFTRNYYKANLSATA